jgi:hypothetical protein
MATRPIAELDKSEVRKTTLCFYASVRRSFKGDLD